MNILYLTTAFPKPQDGATIYTDLAEELSIKHYIEVVVADQNIPVFKYESNTERNIIVHRIGILPYYNVSFIRKGLSALTQSRLLKHTLHKLTNKRKIDLILYESPPTTNAALIGYLKRKTNAKTYLMLKDIFPQNAVDLGIIKKNSILYRYFRRQEKRLYEVSNIIGCMSQANVDYVLSHNTIKEEKVKVFPNTKKIKRVIIDRDDMNDFFIHNEIPKEKILILFGGNMGKPQNMNLLSKIILANKDNSNVHFLCIGRGQEKSILERSIQENSVQNATLVNSLHRDQYESIFSNISIGLVLLNENFTIPNYPSRILSYMEYGIPVFAATDVNTDIKDLIIDNNFGIWANANNPNEVIKRFSEMLNMRDLKEIGSNGRKYIIKHLDVSQSVELIEKHYKELI